VDAEGVPEPNVVWYLWDSTSILIYSQPGTRKLRNLERNPRVSLHLDSDGRGGGVLVITATARIAPEEEPAYRNAEYMLKYGHLIKHRVHETPDSFARDYSVPLRITPLSWRAQRIHRHRPSA
jgi:PPOX class probable F420-dependent enzyme